MPDRTQDSANPRRRFPWRSRAAYNVGKSRHRRKLQLRTQTTMLLITMFVAVVGVGLLILYNWRGATGGPRPVSCADYPDYCVPFAGGLEGDADLALAEAPAARTLDEAPRAAAGVVRGFTPDGMPFIGDPNAPIHFRLVSDYSCSYCGTYHSDDLHKFVRDYVVPGQATLSVAILTGVGGQYSLTAMQAALCAAEQGAFWEMTDELFRLARTSGVRNAYSLAAIEQSASDMGLDAGALTRCIPSGRYDALREAHQTFATNHAVRSTPTVLVSYGDSGRWTRLEQAQRGYDNLAQMTRAAQPGGD